jgi:hypothetical protein
VVDVVVDALDDVVVGALAGDEVADESVGPLLVERVDDAVELREVSEVCAEAPACGRWAAYTPTSARAPTQSTTAAIVNLRLTNRFPLDVPAPAMPVSIIAEPLKLEGCSSFPGESARYGAAQQVRRGVIDASRW